jgi:hypothetical protein
MRLRTSRACSRTDARFNYQFEISISLGHGGRASSHLEGPMADYFTHLSCLLDVGTPERAARVIDFFAALRDDDDKSEEPQFHGFDLSVQDGPKCGVLWIHDDESGDVEAVTAFILRLAEELDLSGLWGFEHSNTCSRPRLDAFGGGAHLIDLGARKVICWVNTQTWLADALNGEDPDA